MRNALKADFYSATAEMAIMRLVAVLHWCIRRLWEQVIQLWTHILLDITYSSLLQTKLCHYREKTPSHLSLPVLSPWDGTNITYGRHHAVTELLSSPSTNNSVAMGLIKRNGTNYGPIPARAVMYCSTLALPQQPDQTSRDWKGWQWEWGGRMWLGRAKLPSNNQSGSWVQCCGGVGEHTERYKERVSLWAGQGHALPGVMGHQQQFDKGC